MTQHHRLHGHHDGPSQHAGPETQKLGLAGRIMWLPPKTVDLGFMDEIYNHPVVVLSPQQTRGKVDFLTMTSFGGMDIRSKNLDRRQNYLPIAPNAPHPDNSKLLKLSNSLDQLSKKTYVQIRPVYTTDLSNLHDYWTRPQRPFHLSQKSYKQLLSCSNYAAYIVESQSGVSPTTQPIENLQWPVSLPQVVSQAGHPFAQSSLDNLRNEAFRQPTLPRHGRITTRPSTTQPPSPLFAQTLIPPPPPAENTDYQDRLSLLRALRSTIPPPPSAPLPSPYRPQPSPLRTTTSERAPLLANSTPQPRSLSQPHYGFYSTTTDNHRVRDGRATNNYTYDSPQRSSTGPSRSPPWVDILLVFVCVAVLLVLFYSLYLATLAVIATALSVWSWVVQTWDAVVAAVVGVVTAVGEAPGRAWNWVLTELVAMARAMPWRGDADSRGSRVAELCEATVRRHLHAFLDELC